MFFTYVFKVDESEVPRLNFEHNYVFFFFSVFPGRLPLCGKMNNFESYPLFDPLDQANFISF